MLPERIKNIWQAARGGRVVPASGRGRRRPTTTLLLTDATEIVWPSTARDYVQLSDEGYTQCAEVYACINVLARTAKGVPWLVYKKQKAGKKLIEIEDNNHPLKQILSKPNPFQSFAKLIENLIGYYKVSGNAYVWRVGPGKDSAPKELWLLRPDRIVVKPAKTPAQGLVAGYTYRVANKTPNELMPDRTLNGEPWHVLMHVKTFNPMDDLYGLSPIRAGARVVDQINEAAKLNYSLLRNGARMSGAFVVKGDMDEIQEADLRRQLTENYAGANNAGKQLLLTGELDWKEMGINPKDMDWIEGQKMDTRRICSIFGVAPELIGDVQNKTYNNQKEARRALYVEAVMPLLDELQDAFNSWLCPLFGDDLHISYDQDQIEAIKDERQAVWVNVLNAVNSGVITPNEGRQVIGFESSNDPKADQLRDPLAKQSNNLLESPSNQPATAPKPPPTRPSKKDAELLTQ